MPAEEIAFKVAFDGPLTDFTRRNPRASVSLWCDWRREVVELSGAPQEDVERLKKQLAEHSSFLEHYPLGGDTHVLVMDCINLPHDFVNEAAHDAHCVSVPPTRFEAGWEHYNVVSFAEEKSRMFFDKVRSGGRTVELLKKSRLEVQPLMNTRSVAVPSLLSGVTDRQLDALLLAARHGLYTSPRATTAATIADAVGLSRSTFEEHLRKAENKLVHNLVPYLELAAKARAAGAAVATPPRP
ncbi:MAG TPA: helix-turn-helix domain-containing protein [Candidatus Thermoplasmatota archaeon]|nr:helix-turn-helix domain-containing protein [Candidatus Thermoplasmatota archaeon]